MAEVDNVVLGFREVFQAYLKEVRNGISCSSWQPKVKSQSS